MSDGTSLLGRVVVDQLKGLGRPVRGNTARRMVRKVQFTGPFRARALNLFPLTSYNSHVRTKAGFLFGPAPMVCYNGGSGRIPPRGRSGWRIAPIIEPARRAFV